MSFLDWSVCESEIQRNYHSLIPWSGPMDDSEYSATSTTLLLRLRLLPFDASAWTEFVERYTRRIQSWCCKWGLQAADAQDVVQIVVVKLLGAMESFQYDPQQRFRAWLKTVAHHAWQDWARSRRRFAAGGTTSRDDPLLSLAARDDLAAQMQRQYEQELLEAALVRVRPRVLPHTWDAFCLTTYEGLPGAEVANRLGIAITSVYKAKSNIQKLLENEIQVLEGVES
jgi:RNA polymerase sigma-70 factor (ECF subfamily)